ncbi:TPA: Xaa-Pro dipeptidase [candidate division CPR2 bacterium]|uniref:Peptidase M24 n=1 Tax=candidate division CPR2 bacterium GW2011_GWC1_41_48 TaxID=1618344 RepID=A0A0G0W8G1_UNCC2|nr:MAG: Peptidase M24 [candidate division CPR2 bacterium GW2011_GWC2_39_35]KKR27768.1 MAG: Peptidase M24 [candidate division CPR2 bacterium GW2011_GWD2_39_7]KKR28052.1 MAG: Peptidase M24 [candidate division CPR2 bacterium GW2011_GWD1_39_7]KKS09274.1 MAG: Peptidase M24 [candidate division CPR2 bacterium GW2011_GWC1_41_48]OGB60273.1 MAG: hypothetical protein A2Y27_03610 [candidate division CPR2 bacterium GWD1_39_7]OGB71876.1 MAG: hypothetical protein A2Y26_02865 [candidate division CPR2 bacteriu
MSFTNRLNNLVDQLKRNDLDALIVTNLKNIYYLTGYFALAGDSIQSFRDPEAVLMVTKKELIIMADKRSAGSVKNVKETRFLEFPYPFSHKALDKILSELGGVKNVGFEADSLIYGEAKDLLGGKKYNFIDASEIIKNLRTTKDPQEIEYLTKAAEVTDLAFQHIVKKINLGMTEKEISREIQAFLFKEGDGVAFGPIVASGVGSAIPHYRPTDKKIKKGDMLLLDFGGAYKGYLGDMTRTIFLGKPTERQKEVYNLVLKAQQEALKTIRPGIRASKPHETVLRFFGTENLAENFLHGTGHGVGLNIHEAPSLSPRGDSKIREGMVFSVEPGLYFENWGGVRIEDVVTVTKDGYRNLTRSSKEMIII